YIHDRGLVHRDVKPGNIRVCADGSVKLMDFGVVKEHGTEHTAVGELIGTVAYMAPEQIQGLEPDVRVDLYALGAVMYLLLTGARVFSAHSIHGFMDKHLNEPPTPPQSIDAKIPDLLQTVALRLLEKDPADRFASAAHLLYALGQRGEEVDVADKWPPGTVGRIPIKARLHESIERVVKSQAGGAFLLIGPTGYGKTRLLELTGAWAEHRGILTAAGRCRPNDRPFGAFTGVYAALAPDGTHPILQAVFGGEGDAPKERYPVITAFRDLVESVGPCVILIDDLENADPATLELLVFLIRNTLERASNPVLFALSLDAPGTRIKHKLAALNALQTLEVGSLQRSEVEELVLSIIAPGAAAVALAHRLHLESRGSPAFIVDMLQGLIDDGRIVDEDGVQTLTVEASEITRSKLPMPASLRQALKERLAPLSPEALILGTTLAISRRALPLDVLPMWTPLQEETVMWALDELLDATIVEEHHADDHDMVGLAHGRHREVLLESVKLTDSQRIHRRLGESIERYFRHTPDAVYTELAYHFENAGITAKAVAYLVHSAKRYLNHSQYEECLATLERATSLEPRARPHLLLDDADRQLVEIYLANAQARFNLGQAKISLKSTQAAEKIAKAIGDARLLSRVYYEMGIELRHYGHNEQSAPYLRKALDYAEEAGDQTLMPGPLYELGGVAWSGGDLVSAEKNWKRSLTIATRIGDQRAQGHGDNGLGILAICQGKSMEARRHIEQSANIFEKRGMLGPLVIDRVNLIEMYLNTGMLRKGLMLSDQTLEQCREAHQLQGTAIALCWRANVMLTLRHSAEALVDVAEALRLVRELGAREDEVLALSIKVRTHFAREDYTSALQAVKELQPLMEHHDHEGIGPQVTAWHARALAGIGRRPAASAVLQARKPMDGSWPHVQMRSQIALGRVLRLLGRVDEARGQFQLALEGAESAGFRYFQLLAHHGLVTVTADPAAKARHQRVAQAMSRSLSANLPKEHAERFVRRNWGMNP
ncbi:MAG: AAA family ATPase, partial [Rhodobacterales bacterium]|nr:AAA family ATPase [Rhodobacterales bacterium]